MDLTDMSSEKNNIHSIHTHKFFAEPRVDEDRLAFKFNEDREGDCLSYRKKEVMDICFHCIDGDRRFPQQIKIEENL